MSSSAATITRLPPPVGDGTRPTIYVLIGPPASGKSTWFEHRAGQPNPVWGETWRWISSDNLIERYATENNMTYSEAWKEVNMKEIEREMFDQFSDALAEGAEIYIDRTNMTRKSRAKFLGKVPKTYNRVAVVFEVDRYELDRRLYARAKATGKSIPDFIVNNMIRSYEPPSFDEFHSIIKV